MNTDFLAGAIFGGAFIGMFVAVVLWIIIGEKDDS